MKLKLIVNLFQMDTFTPIILLLKLIIGIRLSLLKKSNNLGIKTHLINQLLSGGDGLQITEHPSTATQITIIQTTTTQTK